MQIERNKIMPSIPESASTETKRWMTDITNVIKELRENVYDEFTNLKSLSIYANNAAALAGGLEVGDFYRLNSDPDTICIVH